ncbi:unnamed protein product [Closterium sp. NIES-54]
MSQNYHPPLPSSPPILPSHSPPPSSPPILSSHPPPPSCPPISPPHPPLPPSHRPISPGHRGRRSQGTEGAELHGMSNSPLSTALHLTASCQATGAGAKEQEAINFLEKKLKDGKHQNLTADEAVQVRRGQNPAVPHCTTSHHVSPHFTAQHLFSPCGINKPFGE